MKMAYVKYFLDPFNKVKIINVVGLFLYMRHILYKLMLILENLFVQNVQKSFCYFLNYAFFCEFGSRKMKKQQPCNVMTIRGTDMTIL